MKSETIYSSIDGHGTNTDKRETAKSLTSVRMLTSTGICRHHEGVRRPVSTATFTAQTLEAA